MVAVDAGQSRANSTPNGCPATGSWVIAGRGWPLLPGVAFKDDEEEGGTNPPPLCKAVWLGLPAFLRLGALIPGGADGRCAKPDCSWASLRRIPPPAARRPLRLRSLGMRLGLWLSGLAALSGP